jgi:hypothetical protein
VSAWGRLVVHNDGFRAEHAAVEALAIPEALDLAGPAQVRAAAAAVGVPVVGHEELTAYASELGGGVPPALRP